MLVQTTEVPPPVLDLVGTVPQPSGGVSQHIWRLAMRMSNRGCGVLDIYPSARKYPMPGVFHRCSPRHRLGKIVWLRRELRQSAAAVAHVHFCSTRALALGSAWLPRAPQGQRRVLTLHHGHPLDFHRRMNWLARRAAENSLRRFDRIVALSDRQYEFYADSIGIDPQRLARATSFFALPQQFIATTPSSDTERESRAGSGELLLVASGYAQPFYRHEHAVQVVDKLRRRCDARLALCLYGNQDDPEYRDYWHRLRALAECRPYVTLHFDLDLPEFIRVLQAADLYLRPNDVDSYGITVGDAIAVGVPAVASDVCPRHPGAILYPTADYQAFEQVVQSVVDDLATYRRIAIEQPPVDSFDAHLQVYGLEARPDVGRRAAA
jgi:glycosyltransferase involved in cell wall biosynthesis